MTVPTATDADLGIKEAPKEERGKQTERPIHCRACSLFHPGSCEQILPTNPLKRDVPSCSVCTPLASFSSPFQRLVFSGRAGIPVAIILHQPRHTWKLLPREWPVTPCQQCAEVGGWALPIERHWMGGEYKLQEETLGFVTWLWDFWKYWWGEAGRTLTE